MTAPIQGATFQHVECEGDHSPPPQNLPGARHEPPPTLGSPSTLFIVPSRRPTPWQALPPGMTASPPPLHTPSLTSRTPPARGCPPRFLQQQARPCAAKQGPTPRGCWEPGRAFATHGTAQAGPQMVTAPHTPTTAVGSPICWPSSDCRASSSAVAPGSVRRSGCPRAATALMAAEPDGPGSQ